MKRVVLENRQGRPATEHAKCMVASSTIKTGDIIRHEVEEGTPTVAFVLSAEDPALLTVSTFLCPRYKVGRASVVHVWSK